MLGILRKNMFQRYFIIVLFSAGLYACGAGSEGNNADTVNVVSDMSTNPTEQDAFWENIQALCDNAYEGKVVKRPENATQLTGEEKLLAHFRACGEDTIKIPLHVQTPDGKWNRSRTWVLIRHTDSLELRHDHRHEDGSKETQTWYGALTRDAGSDTDQEFLSPDRTLEDGTNIVSGWKMVIDPDQKFTYGLIRNDDWIYDLSFDLENPVNAPPAPWGHE